MPWTCHKCGSQVFDGCTHHCPTTVGHARTPAALPQMPLNPDVTQVRIAAALERIAAALEASRSSTETSEP